ncbi:PAC2 family protein [Nostocoides vanveenii]|uniref:PAC2 family protein n=1 Tax=Nostocoides vanveenii TaxID=330835 RepID=A0ABP4X0I5_9MICO
MQNPHELYRFEADADPAGLEPGVLLLGLGGFIDAGNINGLLITHLLAQSQAQVVASFDVDQVLDYRGRRPLMVFEETQWVAYDDPSLLLYRLTDRDGQVYYLLTGPEPDYQWERMVEAIRALMAHIGVTLVVTAHGIPMAVPHTRPVGLTAHATDQGLIGERNPVFGRVQVPASFAALLEYRLGEQGAPAMGFAVHTPHYLAQADFHDGALTALNGIVDATGLNLPNDALVAAAAAGRAQIDAEVAGNGEIGEAVSALERQYDTFLEGQDKPNLLAPQATPLPSADELAADVEQFLRSVSDDDPRA